MTQRRIGNKVLTTHVRHSCFPTGPKAASRSHTSNQLFASLNASSIGNYNDGGFKSQSPRSINNMSHADVYVEFAYGDEDDEGSEEENTQDPS